MAFATVTQFEAVYGPIEDTDLLGSVSSALDRATKLIRDQNQVIYETSNGTDPTSDSEIETLRAACIEQIIFWLELGAHTKIEQSTDILGLVGELRADRVWREAPPILAPRAQRELDLGGLWRP